MNLTLGSLFDGSGGFPLAGLLNGITPIWASEIEPFPIRVTTKRLPQMKHYGDICTMDGGEIEAVDIITSGSPCQDMSIAGKRAGLEGSRSSLFYEAIRIVKEMRRKTDGRYPRYFVWENVTGAFSSNKGDDFNEVLKAICSVKESEADVPRCDKWYNAGQIMGFDYSVAWRVLDAQYWGVPQRRKRIFLVADFNGKSADKILFNSPSVPWNPPSCFREKQETSPGTRGGTTKTGTICLTDQGGQRMDITEDVTTTLKASTGSTPCIMLESHPSDSRIELVKDGKCQTLTSKMGTGGGNVPLLLGDCFDVRFTSEGTRNVRSNVYQTKISRALDTGGNTPNSNQGGVVVVKPTYSTSRCSHHTQAEIDKVATLTATDYKEPPTVTEDPYYAVRRLTPTECARLQGFPDWWCSSLGEENPSEEEVKYWRGVFLTQAKVEGKTVKAKSDNQIRKWLQNPHSDSAEYKMWGNGVALPCVSFVLGSIANYIRMEEENGYKDNW